MARFLRAEYACVEPPVPQGEEIDALCARNASREWLFPERELVAGYRFCKKARFPFGTLELSLSMHNETVTDAVIRGDFFGVSPIEELEQALCQKTLAELPAFLSGLPLSDYVNGLALQDLLRLLEIN